MSDRRTALPQRTAGLPRRLRRRPDLFSKLILIGASPRFLNNRPELPRRIRAGEIEEVFSAMGERIRAAGGGGGHVGGGAEIQLDAVQHEAGHNTLRLAHRVQQRPERGARSVRFPVPSSRSRTTCWRRRR